MDQTTDVSRHQIERVRFTPRRRTIAVAAVERLTPGMVRISFAADDLRDFSSAAADDHIKLFFPPASGASGDKPIMRDFTPRSFDPGLQTLVVDFALHEAGPATRWASQAQPGQTIEIGGPRGSMVVPDDFDWYLLIGDETALPAIGRRVEELRADARAITLVVVDDARERQTFSSRATWTPMWAFRNSAPLDDAALLRAALAACELPPGEGFVWIAAEAAVARSLRAYIVEERGHPRIWTKASGYWKRGQTDVHERIED